MFRVQVKPSPLIGRGLDSSFKGTNRRLNHAISMEATRLTFAVVPVNKPLASTTHLQLLSVANQTHFTPAQREQRKNSVLRHVLQNSNHISQGNFSSLSNEDLRIIFHAIDENFFDGKISPLCEHVSHRPLAFRLSTRMTTSGGMTTMQKSRARSPQREFEIAIATTPLFETFKHDKSALVCGIECHSRLEALQRIMEHEIVHLLEMLLWEHSNCTAKRFREIVHRFFGHLESNHQLLTPREIARKKLGISPGDAVSFEFEDRTLHGFVNRISKRATVLVASARGTRYSDGKSYHKYYVPLNRLRRR